MNMTKKLGCILLATACFSMTCGVMAAEISRGGKEVFNQFCKKALVPMGSLHKVGIVSGTVVNVSRVEKARNPSYQMSGNFGELGGVRTSVGQFVANYPDASVLPQKHLWGILNFEPRRIAGIKSEYLTIGFYDRSGNAVTLNNRGVSVPDGSRLYGAKGALSTIDSVKDFEPCEIVCARVDGLNGDILRVSIGQDKSLDVSLPLPLKAGVDLVGTLMPLFLNGMTEDGSWAPTPLGVEVQGAFLPLGVDPSKVDFDLGGDLG